MLHIIKLIILFIVCIPSLLLAATLRYSENFNDQTLTQPTTGGYIVWKADYPGGLTAVTAEYITHYIWGTGRGGSGYCWKGAYDGVNLYAQWYPGTWPTNEMYTSMWLRYGNFRNLSGSTNLNLKKYYHYFNGGAYYTAASGYTAYSIYSAPTCGGGYYSTQGINYLDGNWHKWASYLNKTTGHFKLWIDDKLIHDYVNCHSAEWTSFYSFVFNSIDAEGQEGYDFEFDDLEVWDGMPAGTGNVPPSITIATPTDTTTYETSTPLVTITGSASDSDGSVQSVYWVNAYNSSTDVCAGTTSWTCTGIPLYLGLNAITIYATDNDGEGGSDFLNVTYSQAGDFTAPAVTLVSPTSSYYAATSSSVTISGTASDNVAVKRHDWTCDNCTTTSGTASGTTSWSFDLSLGSMAYGPDLNPGGDFDSDEFWEYDAGWTVTGGTAVSASGVNQGLQHYVDASQGAQYELRYDVDAYTSGTLYISQWGMIGTGNSKALTTTVGELTDTFFCRDATLPFRFATDSTSGWIGTLNYARLFQKGMLNKIVITTYDTSDNITTTTLYVSYFVSTDRDLSFAGSGGRTVTCCSGSGGRTVSINN